MTSEEKSPPTAIEEKIVAALERIGHALRGRLRAEAARRGLSPIQAQILLRLRDAGERDDRLARLAAYFDLAKGTLSEAIGTLERKRLVVRRRGGEDGRVRRLGLTPKGRAVAARLAAWSVPPRRAVAELDAAERNELYRSLLDVIAALQRAGLVTVARMCLTCRFFERRPATAEVSFYCRLLERPLADADLRLDCPEHEVA